MLSVVYPKEQSWGPVLFLVLISDIDNGISSKTASFADDTRISRPIKNIADTIALQNDLETVYNWQRENNMLFNDEKFELLRYGKNVEIKSQTTYSGPTGTIIQEKSSIRDLGVTMSNSLRFNDHLDKVCSVVKNHCGWIYRTFKSRNECLMKSLWNSLIQPRIDYCSQLWGPTTIGNIQRLEALFRSYTNRIPSKKHLNYWDRLRSLHMYSQERRHDRYKIIYIWKVLENMVHNFGITVHNSPRHGRICKI